MEPSIKPELLIHALNFHGQQLQKVWEADRGETDFVKLNIDVNGLDFGVFQQRQKHLSFQDRGKRLKLHQFIVKKASALYDSTMMEGITGPREKNTADDDFYAVMPPFETFLDLDKSSKTRRFFELVKYGDVVICSIHSKSVSGMMLKVLCTDGEFPRYLADLNVKALCPVLNIIPAVDKNAVPRNYLINDTVCCEVLEVIADTDKLVVGMKGVSLEPKSSFVGRLGLIHSDDFPAIFKKAQEMKGENYEKSMERSLGFSNPNNITYLSNILGLGHTHYSNMQGMRGRFSEQEYATELRQVQASKWAFKSVAEGIEHFKSSRHSEAFQCLNKALHIDPRNVEGLVARGALYANSGSFHKAIEDFENALKLNQNHQNARKYMGETLVALGRSFEDENKFDDALKSYENCLALIPFHEEAQNSIEFLKSKINSKLSDADGATLPGLASVKSLEVKETLKHLLKNDDEDLKKDKDRTRSKKKKERKSRKRRRRSSTSSSSSSSASSRTSSSSSSSTSDSSSGSSHSGSVSPSRSKKSKKHKRREKKDKKDKSLSPLSKRMALMDPSCGDADGLTGLLAQRLSHYNPPALPFAFTRSAAAYPEPEIKLMEKDNDYEQRVCRFLEQTKGDSEYEEKVRKFLEETARWRKEKKAIEEKTSKKKKRKEKKSRDKDKGKKKKDHDKKKKHRSKKGDKVDVKEFEDHMESKKFRDALRKELGVKEELRKRKGIEDDEEFLYGHPADKKDFRLLGLDNLPDLDDLETKLSAYYAKVEKGTGLSKGRNDDRPDKKRPLSPKVMFVHHDSNEDKDLNELRDKKKNVDMFAETSMLAQDKSKLAAAETSTLMNLKWKMQIGSVGSKIKKREKNKFDQEPWENVEEKRFLPNREDNLALDSDEELQKKRKKLVDDKVLARKAAMLEASEKRVLEKQKKDEGKREEILNKPQTGAKFQGGFRSIAGKVSDKKDDMPPLPPGIPPKVQFPIRAKPGAIADPGKALRGDVDDNGVIEGSKKIDKKKQLRGKESAGSSPSRSQSRGKYSRHSSTSRSRKSGSFERRRSRSGSYVARSRSRSYGRYRSSGSRSRSRSFRSRSRSFNSRSRSRSEDGHYRRRSRSPSDDRRRRDYHMNKYQGRYPRNRGTYYRPRFQNYKSPRGFPSRGGRNFHPKFMHGRGGRPFIHRGRGRGGGGGQRFFHYKRGQGYKDYHNRDRRYDRPRSRDSDDRRSYSREDEDPMKKVDAAKEKINKYLADEEQKDQTDPKAVPKRSKDDPLSEGEERDEEDYPPLPPGGGPSYVDRKVFEEKA